MKRKPAEQLVMDLAPRCWIISHYENGEIIRGDVRYTLIEGANVCRELNEKHAPVPYWLTLVKEE